jgi:hypothetical protein
MPEPTVDKEMARAVVQVLQVIEDHESIIQQQEATKQELETGNAAKAQEGQAWDERNAAAAQAYHEWTAKATRAREDARTADIDYRARIIRKQEELADLNGRIPQVQAQLHSVESDLQEAMKARAAEKLERMKIA